MYDFSSLVACEEVLRFQNEHVYEEAMKALEKQFPDITWVCGQKPSEYKMPMDKYLVYNGMSQNHALTCSSKEYCAEKYPSRKAKCIKMGDVRMFDFDKFIAGNMAAKFISREVYELFMKVLEKNYPRLT